MAKRKTNTQIVNGLVKQFNDNEMVFVSAIIRQVIDEYVEKTKDIDVEVVSQTDPFFQHTRHIATKSKEYLDEQYGSSF
jgi:hypothetical protein